MDSYHAHHPITLKQQPPQQPLSYYNYATHDNNTQQLYIDNQQQQQPQQQLQQPQQYRYIRGLPVIAETISSYKPYSNYYCNFKKEDVSDIFRSQEKWYNLVREAQIKTQEDFSNKRLISLWNEFFEYLKK